MLMLMLMLLAVSAHAQVTPAAQWFLDNSSGLGNDSNNCTARATPCLTVAGVLAKTILAGDLVAVRCTGTAFREEFIPPANNVGLTTYDCGSLAAPIFDASDIISAGAWAKTGGLSVTYQAGSLPVAFAGDSWVNVWENGTNLIYEPSCAAVDGVAGSYFPSSVSVSPITICVHASDGTNPGANGKTYEYSNRQAGYDSYNVTGAKVYGIVTQKNSLNDGSLRIGQNGVATNVTAAYGSKHNFLLRQGAVCYNCTAHNAYFGGQSFILFVYNENTATNGPIRYTLCTATLDSYDPQSAAFYGHVNTGGAFSTIFYDRDAITNVSLGFTAIQAANVIIYNGTVTNAQSAASLSDGYIVDGLAATVQSLGNAGHLVDLAGGRVSINNLTGSSASIYGLFWNNGTALNLTITNSNFTVGSGGGFLMDLAGTGLLTLNSNHNTLGNNPALPYGITQSGAVISSDFNTFSASGAGNYVAQINSVYSNLTQWKALGYDTHSTP